MPGTSASNVHIHVTNLLGFVGFLLLWLGFVECTRWLIKAMRNDPLIGWSIGPLGVSTLFLYEPSTRFIVLSASFPAFISGCILYLGLFTTLPSPLALPHTAPTIVLALALGILVTSLGDWRRALRDLRYPLWGEARILRNIQSLRASCASIHFTTFGRSYLREHFGSNPSELLQAL
ncbi:MAG: hypothetical protein ABI234_04780 [Ktedonobacteraceae bacterium]